MRRLGVARALVDGELVPGDVGLDEDRIAGVGLDGPGQGTAAPGFVDLQVNGFGGVDLLHADHDGYARVGEMLAATGVVAYQPTFITAGPDEIGRALAVLAELRRAPIAGSRVLDAHLEGPFLSPRWPGTHPIEHLRDPDADLVDRWLATGQVGAMTLAPELPGGLHLVAHLVAAGVVVSCGHTDADAATSHAAFDEGATTVTHLFNAMRPFSHRDPGIVGVALARPDVSIQLIVDGIHLRKEAVVLAWLAAVGRVALVTDATAAAGMPDGSFTVGTVAIAKEGLEVRCPDGSLAGSALTMDAAVRGAVDCGIDLASALSAASTTPAAIVRAEGIGRILPGAVADVVVLDEDLVVTRTLRAGREVA